MYTTIYSIYYRGAGEGAMEEILKGNFKVKNPVVLHEEDTDKSFEEEYRKRVLASIGGSMVFMERTILVWEGDR